MNAIVRRVAVSLALPLTALGACDDGVPIACTEEFRVITVTVVDTVGVAVQNAEVVSTVRRTGMILPATSLALFTAGTYPIADDGSRGKLRISGDSVDVTARQLPGPVTAATYFLDVPSGCHVNKVSGPDTLVVH